MHIKKAKQITARVALWPGTASSACLSGNPRPYVLWPLKYDKSANMPQPKLLYYIYNQYSTKAVIIAYHYNIRTILNLNIVYLVCLI